MTMRPDEGDSHGIETSRARALPLLELPVLGADAGATASGASAQGGQASTRRANGVDPPAGVRGPASSAKAQAQGEGRVRTSQPGTVDREGLFLNWLPCC